ncbi:hypothetical protein Sme01_49000 [Sphaerisporangium melleum]|uniref:ABC transporter substrate-binding protein n=1 Tax=Sphaerisporangium melleum TaxID=321316 RepID=A0A917R388_9ACTN|nr:transporter substrate-binding domain-containing protein [Sphaerisporangium melleum]GGK87586.1 hypothetical protein GCM10007964_32690 [Sphaerisporangium melleum]GII72424.1 hypothetical protein Sme01_49000 [Sphaerisporangium melleum]
MSAAPVLDKTAADDATPETLRVVQARHPWRWAATAVVLVLLAMAVNALVTNPAWDWPVVRRYLFHPSVVDAVLFTVELTALGIVLGFVLGTLLALMRLTRVPLLTYRLDQLAWEVPKDSKITAISAPADIAGLNVSVGSGTNQEKILLDGDRQNRAKGLKPIQVQYYKQASDTYLALKSGRVDAYFGPNPTAAYHAAVSGDTKIVGTLSGAGPTLQGLIAAMTKKGSGVAEPVRDALNVVIENGTYAEVLKRWGLANEAVPESLLNPPGLPRTSG